MARKNLMRRLLRIADWFHYQIFGEDIRYVCKQCCNKREDDGIRWNDTKPFVCGACQKDNEDKDRMLEVTDQAMEVQEDYPATA